MKYWWGRINVEKITLTISLLLYLIKEILKESSAVAGTAKYSTLRSGKSTSAHMPYTLPIDLFVISTLIPLVRVISAEMALSDSQRSCNPFFLFPDMICVLHTALCRLSTVILTPYAAGLISCGLRALPTKTLLLPCTHKLGTNRPKFGNIFHAGCLLGGFFPPCFVAVLDFWHDVSQNFSS